MVLVLRWAHRPEPADQSPQTRPHRPGPIDQRPGPADQSPQTRPRRSGPTDQGPRLAAYLGSSTEESHQQFVNK
ncbi:unnamed protein product [Lota lota]